MILSKLNDGQVILKGKVVNYLKNYGVLITILTLEKTHTFGGRVIGRHHVSISKECAYRNYQTTRVNHICPF